MKLIQHGQLDGSMEASVAFLDSWGKGQEDLDREDAVSALQGIGNELSLVSMGPLKLTRHDIDEAKALCKDAVEAIRGLSA